jgi:hypothetical protein
MYFILETPENKEAANSLLKKMSKKGGPGALILLTPEEHELAGSMHIVPIGPPPDVALCPHNIPMSKACAKCQRFGAA